MPGEPLQPRAGKAHSLPFDLRKVTDAEERDLRKLVERLIKAEARLHGASQ